MPLSPERRAYLLLVVIIVLWGVNWPIMKAGLTYVSPQWFGVGRIVLAALCLFPVAALQGRLRWPHRSEFALLISIGALQVGVNTALVHGGLQFIEAGRSAILAYTTPLWVTPLAALLLDERLHWRKLAGIGLGLAGIATLSGSPAALLADRDALIGNGMMVLVAVISAATMVHVRASGRLVRPFDLAPWQMLMGAAVMLPIALIVEGPPAIHWSTPLVAIVLYNGILGTAFGLWALTTVMRDLPATSTAVGSLGVPVVGMIASAIFLGEALTPAKATGLALIVGGVLAVSLADLRRG